MTRAPYSRAMSHVRSEEPESTRTISLAQRTLSRTCPMLASSFKATIAIESESGMETKSEDNGQVFSHRLQENACRMKWSNLRDGNARFSDQIRTPPDLS